MTARNCRGHWISIALLVAAVLGTGAVALTQAKDFSLLDSLSWGAATFSGGFFINLAVVDRLGLIDRNSD
ncbi:hypothetical protein ACFVQ9_13875 [Streptomyces goshikiensis]|uniref:hypothetical protein n=1 Tax=Streptomyces goshikiensis TaxID=1942 RepID=UPI0036769F38